MVLLWKDPEGKTISTLTHTKSQNQKPTPNVNDMNKIASLENAITEKDSTIVRLKGEINALKSVQV